MLDTATIVEIGDMLSPLRLAPVSRATLALFAGASGDHNPIHIDIDFARRAGMPDVFVHGMLSMAYVARLLTGWQPQSRLRSFGARFVAITHLGNEIVCGGRVTAVGERNGENCAWVKVTMENQYGQSKIAGEAVVAL